MPDIALARRVLLGLPLVLLAACSRAPEPGGAAATPAAPPVLTTPDARDVHSHADPLVARVTHVDLDLVADFDDRSLSGSATLDLEATGTGPLTLDTRGLDISAVEDGEGRALEWSLGEADAVLGAPLRVQIGEARRVVVRYRTRPEAAALQWLAPAQTAGGAQPFLYSQGQAILNRTWIPTQDSPGIRQTWSARITAPEALTVVMSAEMLGPEPAAAGQRVWRFRMPEPVPPYLIALGIGELGFRELGMRTGVYAEHAVLDAAASEFADVERMIEATEALYGPYRWGRYDLLVLPPAFPYGGMENPRLTFLTPTVIAGDRSLVSLVAHELAHSWSGNLVTNATWADFWLNEGFTVYIEDRIMERVYGEQAATMLAELGWDGLQEDIQSFGGEGSPATRLHRDDLAGSDPDSGLSGIPYEKGAAFLRTIEAAVGRERWDAWLRDYFDRHAFQPQTSAGFLADLRANLIGGDVALERHLQLDRWVYEPGLPDNVVRPRSPALARMDAAAEAFGAGRGIEDPAGWSSAERVRFLGRLPRRLPADRLAELSRLLDLGAQRNSEVRFEWLRLVIANRYEPALPALEEFLASMGRRKFVLPLYQELVAQGEWGRELARRLYAQTRPGYHSVTAGSVDEVVGPLP